ncbi:MAG: cob(I)yrinic acid a,c-diamide adenosyltransferase [Planctomycetota bacterium]|nr:cob(I)yrinic acid a,c-diamide adenosyltransferase [Planctomycetota bacterium]
MKIYTRGGDDGSTGLYGGARVSKADLRVDAYGAVDELNAYLGWIRVVETSDNIDVILDRAQDACFRLGAWLASPPGRDPGVAAVTEEDVEVLEASIDAMEAQLEPLKTFVLPGGCEAAARFHIARTVCRRAERRIVALAETEAVEAVFIRWVNRVSDLLFVQARWENARAGVPDVPWPPAGGADDGA